MLNTSCFVYPRGILFFVGHSFPPAAFDPSSVLRCFAVFCSVAPSTYHSRDRSACWCGPAHPPLKFPPTTGPPPSPHFLLERPILISIATRPPYRARSPRRCLRRDIQVPFSTDCRIASAACTLTPLLGAVPGHLFQDLHGQLRPALLYAIHYFPSAGHPLVFSDLHTTYI